MSDSPFAEIDDRMLMRMHVEGDAEAFGEIYRRHRDRMWAVAVGVCGDRELAAEAVQDAFVSAFRRAGSYRGDAAVTTWLHRIVVNACIDLTRRVRPTSELTDEVVAAAPPAPDATGRVDTRLAVHEAMRRLPDEQRVALVLVDMHGVPVAEAAEMLGIAPGTVKSRGNRGRAAIASYLRQGEPQGTRRAARSSETEEQPREEEPQ